MNKKYEYSRVFSFEGDKVNSIKNILIAYVAEQNFLVKLGLNANEYSDKDITNIVKIFENIDSLDANTKESLETFYNTFVIAQIITDITYKQKSNTSADYWFSRSQYDDVVKELKKEIKHCFTTIKLGDHTGNTRDAAEIVNKEDSMFDNLTPEQIEMIKAKYGLK